jgi:hypothetical protein
MKTRILVICAPEDTGDRDSFVAHLAKGHRGYELIVLSAEGPWDAERKTCCRERIRSCNRVIALVGKHTHASRGARWQIECAGEEGKPTLGVHLSSYTKGKIPPELVGCKVIDLMWSDIEAFLDGRSWPPRPAVSAEVAVET